MPLATQLDLTIAVKAMRPPKRFEQYGISCALHTVQTYSRKETMCPWEELSPWEEWAIEMTAPGLDLLSKMQTEFEESEEGKLEEEGCLAWAEDAHEVVAVQVLVWLMWP